MNIIAKVKLAAAGSKLIDALGAIPHGPNLTMVVSGALILSQWFMNNLALFDPSIQPWLQVFLAVLNGVYSVSALLAPTPDGTPGKSASLGRAVSVQVLASLLQVLSSFALVPGLSEEMRGLITDAIPVVQNLQAMRWLHEERATS